MSRTCRPCSSSGRRGRWPDRTGSRAPRRGRPFPRLLRWCTRAIHPHPALRARYETSQRSLFLLLDGVLEVGRHWRNGLAREFHGAIGASAHDNVEGGRRRILLRIVIAEMPAAAFLALDRRARNRLGYGQQVLQVHRRVPPRVVLPVAVGADLDRKST